MTWLIIVGAIVVGAIIIAAVISGNGWALVEALSDIADAVGDVDFTPGD